MNRFIIPFALTLVSVVPAVAVDFVHEIAPILKKNCAECHMGIKHKGGFSMNTREDLLKENDDGAAVLIGNSAKSLLMHQITTDDEDERMPPKGDRLQEKEVQLIAAWINAGVPWEPGFTFKNSTYEPPLKPRRPVLPAVQNGRAHPIDRIIDAYLTKNKITSPVAIDEASFVRRVYLDLIGVLPSSEALQTYLADTRPDKRAILVQSLLAQDVPYATHWMTFWNDLLRNDYTGTGFITGGRSQISEWLFRSLAENKPYNQFASELIAPTKESEGFANGIKWRGSVSAGQTVPIQYAQSVGQTFLGINLKCASCHDSFTDNWKLTDSYGLAAAFSNEKIEIARCDKPTGKIAEPYWLYPELGKIDVSQPPAVRLKQVAALTTTPANGRFSRTIVNRLWHRLMGRGIVHPVDAMSSEPWNADLLDYLATYLVDNQYDLKKVMAHICLSQAYQSKTAPLLTDDESKWKYQGPRAKRMTAEEFVDAVWQITGTAPAKSDFVPKAAPAKGASSAAKATWIWSNDGVNSPAGETIAFRKNIELKNPVALAKACISCDNAFTLSINGKEVVKSDDWMKPVVVDLKPYLVIGANEIQIIGSNGGAGPNAAGLYVTISLQQGDQRAAIVSDSSWQTTTAAGGVIPPNAVWTSAVPCGNQLAWSLIDADVANAMSQTIVSTNHMVRAGLMKSDFLMRALGRPNREQIVTSRPSDLTTLEAMDLNNGSVLAQLLEKGAAKLLVTHASNPSGMIDMLYWRSLSRAPTPEEKALAVEVLGTAPTSETIQDLLWTIFMLPEFQLIR